MPALLGWRGNSRGPQIPSTRASFTGATIVTVESRAVAVGQGFTCNTVLADTQMDPNNLWIYGWIDYRDSVGTEGVLPFCAFYAHSDIEGVLSRFIDVDVSWRSKDILTNTEERDLRLAHGEAYGDPPPSHSETPFLPGMIRRSPPSDPLGPAADPLGPKV